MSGPRVPMTNAERAELRKLVNLRSKLAKADIDQQEAHQLAELEAQLAAHYDANHEAWAEITKQARERVAELDAKIAAICKQRGVREEFRPGLDLNWYGRGVNADRQRRTELRRVAQTRLAANAKAAKLEVDRRVAILLTDLAQGALESAEARGFLDAIPTPDQLMPRVTLLELEQKVQGDE